MTNCGKEIEYEAKTVSVAGRRYIVRRNHAEATKDAADPATIVAALERQLAKGDRRSSAIPRVPPLSQDNA